MSARKPPAKPRKRSSSTRKGRPSLCTPVAIDAIVAHLASGGGLRSAAPAAGVSVGCLCEWMARGRAGEAPYDELVRRVEGARGAVVEEMRGIVIGLARSDDPHVAGTNARWLLERLDPDHYGRRQEISGPKGGPVQVEAKVSALLSDDAVAEMDGEKLADTLAGLATKTREGT